MREKTESLLKIHAAVLLFGLTGLFARLLDLPAVYIVLGRVFFASVSLYAILRINETDMTVRVNDALLLLMSGAVLAFHWTSFFQSVKVSTVAIAVMTFSTFPIFLIFIEPVLFNEKLKVRNVIFAGLMLCGVYLIVPEFSFDSGTTLGVACGMASGLSYAVLSLLNRRLAANYSGATIAFYEQAAATALLLPVLWFTRSAVSLSLMDWTLLLLLGVVFTGISHSLYISGMKHVSAQTAGMIAGSESVYGIVSAALLLAEYPSSREVVGGIIILGAAFMSTWFSSKE